MSLLDCPAYVVVKEPLLYLEHEMDSSFSEFDDAAVDIFSALERAVKASEVKQSKLILSLSQAEEPELWRKFEEAEPAVLELHDVSRSQESLAARLARAQWRRNQAFLVKPATSKVGKELSDLKTSSSSGSAAYLLFRKAGAITNFVDHVKYGMARAAPLRIRL